MNRYRFVLNGKVIWDNLEFIDMINEIKTNNKQTVEFRLATIDNEEYINICGWKINIKSTLHLNAATNDVHIGWNSLNDILKLKNLDSRHVCAPFFVLESHYHFTSRDVPGSEPLLVIFIRLCHWIGKCIIINGFETKHKEIRDCVNRPLNILELIGKNAEALIRYDDRNKNTSVERIREWFRKIISIISELMFASQAEIYDAKVSFKGKHDFFIDDVPVEVKTVYPRFKEGYSQVYPYLNSIATSKDIELRRALIEFIKLPKIMDNNIKVAIEEQRGEIIFVNIILESLSEFLTFLSDYSLENLEFEQALGEAIKSKGNNVVPAIIIFTAIHCEYQTFAIMLPMPVRREEDGSVRVNL
jgi:CRISPR/Cas system-associated exonuclease Cas4 (RecB family)